MIFFFKFLLTQIMSKQRYSERIQSRWNNKVYISDLNKADFGFIKQKLDEKTT